MIPDLYSGTAVDSKDPRDKASLYHWCMEKGFQELKDLQDTPIFLDIRFGDYIKRMKVFLSIVFVIGDQKSNDLLCLRKSCTHNAGRIHGGCMTSSLNASNPEWQCEWVRKDII